MNPRDKPHRTRQPPSQSVDQLYEQRHKIRVFDPPCSGFLCQFLHSLMKLMRLIMGGPARLTYLLYRREWPRVPQTHGR